MAACTDSKRKRDPKRWAAYMASYRAKNRAHVNRYARDRRRTKHDHVNKVVRLRYLVVREKILDRNTAWVQRNREKVRSQRAAHRSANRSLILARRRKSADRDKAQGKKWRAANRERLAAYMAAYERDRLKADPLFKLRKRLRNRIKAALAGAYRLGAPLEWLGCSPAEAKTYIEAQFAPGMTWSNWGTHGWHIDHKRPLSSFDLSDTAELKAACHITNLQPLWAADNLAKGARYGKEDGGAACNEL